MEAYKAKLDDLLRHKLLTPEQHTMATTALAPPPAVQNVPAQPPAPAPTNAAGPPPPPDAPQPPAPAQEVASAPAPVPAPVPPVVPPVQPPAAAPPAAAPQPPAAEAPAVQQPAVPVGPVLGGVASAPPAPAAPVVAEQGSYCPRTGPSAGTRLATGVGVRAPSRLSIAVSASASAEPSTRAAEAQPDASTVGDHSVHPVLVTPTLLADTSPTYPTGTPSFLRAIVEHVTQNPDCVAWVQGVHSYVVGSPISRPTVDGMLGPINVTLNVNQTVMAFVIRTQIHWVPELPLAPIEPALIDAFLIGNTVNFKSVQNALGGPLRFNDNAVPVILGESLRCSPTRYDNTGL